MVVSIDTDHHKSRTVRDVDLRHADWVDDSNRTRRRLRKSAKVGGIILTFVDTTDAEQCLWDVVHDTLDEPLWPLLHTLYLTRKQSQSEQPWNLALAPGRFPNLSSLILDNIALDLDRNPPFLPPSLVYLLLRNPPSALRLDALFTALSTCCPTLGTLHLADVTVRPAHRHADSPALNRLFLEGSARSISALLRAAVFSARRRRLIVARSDAESTRALFAEIRAAGPYGAAPRCAHIIQNGEEARFMLADEALDVVVKEPDARVQALLRSLAGAGVGAVRVHWDGPGAFDWRALFGALPDLETLMVVYRPPEYGEREPVFGRVVFKALEGDTQAENGDVRAEDGEDAEREDGPALLRRFGFMRSFFHALFEERVGAALPRVILIGIDVALQAFGACNRLWTPSVAAFEEVETRRDAVCCEIRDCLNECAFWRRGEGLGLELVLKVKGDDEGRTIGRGMEREIRRLTIDGVLCEERKGCV